MLRRSVPPLVRSADYPTSASSLECAAPSVLLPGRRCHPAQPPNSRLRGRIVFPPRASAVGHARPPNQALHLMTAPRAVQSFMVSIFHNLIAYSRRNRNPTLPLAIFRPYVGSRCKALLSGAGVPSNESAYTTRSEIQTCHLFVAALSGHSISPCPARQRASRRMGEFQLVSILSYQ